MSCQIDLWCESYGCKSAHECAPNKYLYECKLNVLRSIKLASLPNMSLVVCAHMNQYVYVWMEICVILYVYNYKCIGICSVSVKVHVEMCLKMCVL